MQRKHLIPLIAAEALAVVIGGIFLVSQATSSGAETERQGVDLQQGTVTATSATTSAVEITGTSTVVLTATTEPAQPAQRQAPAVQNEPGGQPPAGQPQTTQPAEPVETVDPAPPGNLLTTTTGATTTRVPDMPWCYNPSGKFWYSGVGEGCHEGSVDFVEYR